MPRVPLYGKPNAKLGRSMNPQGRAQAGFRSFGGPDSAFIVAPVRAKQWPVWG